MSADWTYQGEKIDAIPDQYEGFVYLITNTTNNKKYIGKNSQNSKQQSHHSKEEKTKDEDTKKATGKHIGEVQIYSKKMSQNSERTNSPGKSYTSVNLEV